MNRQLIFAAAASLAAPALAQAPIYIDLSPGSYASDVTVANGDVFVAGENISGIFRWSLSTNQEDPTGEFTGGQGNVRISEDGSRIGATVSGGVRAAIWTGGLTWQSTVGIGTCGSDETAGYGISGDGQRIAGLGWLGCQGRAWTWDATSGPVNLGGINSSRANDINYDGSVVVGWLTTSSTWYASRWVNGVQSYPTIFIGSTQYAFGPAEAVNSAGTKIVGSRIIGYNSNTAWIWDSTTGGTELPGIAGGGAAALDLSDDGSIVVGHTGGSILGSTALIWINHQPQNLHAYLTSLGTQGIGAYSDLGIATGISRDGNAICGRGTGFGTLGQPAGGWVVIFPDAIQAGTKFCSGDGTATACPCGNVGAAGHGCANSVNSAGAELTGTGMASISSDSLTLSGAGMPNAPALYFQGTAQFNGGLGAVFGDGLRCAGGTVVRLGTKTNSAGSSHYPAAGDQSVSVRGNVQSAGTRTYQVWYRNAAAFCTASTYNLSNGLEITWAP